MKKALIVLAFVISVQGLKAEESQVPFKVGDVVKLCEPSSAKDFPPLVFVVKEIKGKWVAGEGWDIIGKKGELFRYNDWFNTERYLYIVVNDEEDLSRHGLIPPSQIPPIQMPAQNTNKTFVYSVEHGKFIAKTNSQSVVAGINAENTNTSTNFFPRPRRNMIPVPKVEKEKKDAPSVKEESK